ncbi:Bos1p ASCRUDRAFT_77499 [Ascoidea rubescens DSM 1968]|uniref:Protein transport protein BOS1 n=1 Tax=Ascoidea rubescens DSM 1968 TaxID=1344418 RepID=A0A1D2VBU5_9ASCO|nr:hypothetical protein ASCRUDRAFT_77499 [Ascoidea rubescens DSM 1968]ODV59106.1 hypothetical protein ASCRUDRAFT_77499 [Ascoidea rubescens DSM 1968]
MNSLYNLALKQTQLLHKDLNTFENNYKDAPLSLQGQISTTISSLDRTLLDYSKLSSNEHDPVKKEKISIRISNFEKQLSESKVLFQSIKKKKQNYIEEYQRNQLFISPESNLNNRFQNRSTHNGNSHNSNSTSISNDNPYSQSNIDYNHNLHKETQNLNRSNQQLDEILEMGREAFDNIVEQNEYIRLIQNKLLNSLNTLGVSQSTIRQIDKIAFKDKWFFYIGALLVFLFFYLIIKFFK